MYTRNQKEDCLLINKKWSQIKEVKNIEGFTMSGHIHLCLSIPPELAISSVIGILKGKSP
ncbi:MAG: transposase [Bdellovibrionales bacterium]|nr:transposase [Bdellovibrionales bacterium]